MVASSSVGRCGQDIEPITKLELSHQDVKGHTCDWGVV